MWQKVIGILLIAFGEALAIYCEVVAARHNQSNRMVWWMLFWITVAGFPLIGGYVLCYRAFQRIWPVTVISVVSILMVEPAFNWMIFKEVPTAGALVGFLLGAAGFICAITF